MNGKMDKNGRIMKKTRKLVSSILIGAALGLGTATITAVPAQAATVKYYYIGSNTAKTGADYCRYSRRGVVVNQWYDARYSNWTTVCKVVIYSTPVSSPAV